MAYSSVASCTSLLASKQKTWVCDMTTYLLQLLQANSFQEYRCMLARIHDACLPCLGTYLPNP